MHSVRGTWKPIHCVTGLISRHALYIYFLYTYFLYHFCFYMHVFPSRNSLLISYAFHQIAAAHAHATRYQKRRKKKTTAQIRPTRPWFDLKITQK